MKKKINTILLSLVLGLSANAQVTATVDNNIPDSLYSDSIDCDTITWEEEVKLGLEEMAIEARNAYYTVGMSVYDLSADSSLFTFNDKKVLRPASTEKLLTAISALSILGGTHEYHTKAYYTGSIVDSTLNGDIYVVGDMDPTYTYEKLCQLAKDIQDQGIKTIKGKLYADISMKDSLLYGKGWCWDDVPSKYEPYLPALLFDRGQNSPGSTKYSTDVNFRPWLHFMKTLGDVLQDNGVSALSAEGDTLEHFIYGTQNLPLRGVRCFYNEATTIETVLQRMMKNSDNLYAESMFWQLAKFNKGKSATYKDGVRHVENTIRKAGASTNQVEVVDGSGVSLYNYHSADTQIALLRYAYNNEKIFKYLYPSLPVSGKDGTLSDRMSKGNTKYNVHAKTGTLSGVSSLSGYITASNGHTLAFSIIINGVLKNSVGHNFQDRVCTILAR